MVPHSPGGVTPFTRVGRQRHEPINDFRLAALHQTSEGFFRSGGDCDFVGVSHERLFILS